MRNLLILTVLLLNVNLAYCQDEAEGVTKNLQCNIFVSPGSSFFKSNITAPEKFATFEARAGISVEKSVAKSVDLKFRLLVGAKFKRESYNDPNGVYTIGPPFIFLDEVSSGRNHYFFEMPLLIVGKINHPKINLFIGPNYRFYFPNNDDVDMLTNRGEWGILLGATIPLTKKLIVGLEYYAGISKLNESVVFVDGQEYDFYVRSQFGALSIEYLIGRNR